MWSCCFIEVMLYIMLRFCTAFFQVLIAQRIANCLLLIGNMIWALGEIYYPEDDDYAFLMWNR